MNVLTFIFTNEKKTSILLFHSDFSHRYMLDAGASVNFYMFYGGTNFGFTAGANNGKKYTLKHTHTHNETNNITLIES